MENLRWIAATPDGGKSKQANKIVNAALQVLDFDGSKFGGDTVIDIMRTHPMIIIGGLLQRNPFFVPPEEFLPEIRQRRAMRTSTSSEAA